jgi:hypothetical protein
MVQNDETPIKQVFLAGEGTNELGSWSRESEYRDDQVPGVLETLLRKTKNDGWTIKDAVCWKNIRKFKAGAHRSAEEKNILGVCLMAIEKGCSIIALSRDADNVDQRKNDIDKGINKAREMYGTKIGIVAECTVPCIEGWILAILGEPKTEQLSKVKAISKLIEKGVSKKCTEQMVTCIETADFDKVSKDAAGLRQWLDTAKKHLVNAS